MKRHWLTVFFCSMISLAHAEDVYTYATGEIENDSRYVYEQAVLKLALEKTVETYGPYKLIPSKVGSNVKRNEQQLIDGTYENFIVKLAYEPRLADQLAYIPFPVERGILGYRVFFTSEKIKGQLKDVTTLEQLKKFSILQGIGWSDVSILREAGFDVKTGTNYDTMFKMVAVNRADLFSRGVTELYGEWQARQDVKGLTFDESISLHYPVPRFFFINKKNQQALKRIQDGLEAAYADGSFQELWHKNFDEGLNVISLKNRKIFNINNPGVAGLDTSYEKYNYKPE